MVDTDVKFLELIESVSAAEVDSQISDTVWAAATDKVNDYLLCEQSYGEDRPSEEEDCIEHKWKSEVGLGFLQIFLKKLKKFAQLYLNKTFKVSVLLLCGEHSSLNLWTSPKCIEISEKCLELLVSLQKCGSVSHLLVSKAEPQQLFVEVLFALRPKLLKETFRLYPAAVCCYQWALLLVKSPHLSEHLSRVLPTALTILDDFVVSRQLIGIVSVTHIIENVTRTELCSQGWDNVLYHTLQPLLLQREPDLVQPVYACTTALLARTEQGYTKSVASGEWNRLESTLLTLLRNMEHEDRLVLRLAYAKSLEPLLVAMGPSVIQFSKILLCIFEEYLHSDTPDTRHLTLLAFETYIRNSSERLPFNGEKVTFLLLRTLYDITKALGQCATCSKNTSVLCSDLFDEEHTSDDAVGLCSSHQWTTDLKIVIRCLNFIKDAVPVQFSTLRSDVIEKINFSRLLTAIVQHVF